MINKKILEQVCNNNKHVWLKGKPYLFVDNNAPVLAIAHADTVAKNGERQPFYIKNGKVYSINLDNRIGVYTILYVLPKLSISTDILITDDEEMGMSTITQFMRDYPDKTYNWAVQFDRRNADVALYDNYYNDTWTEAIEITFDNLVMGSYTDVAHWDRSAGMNIGNGMNLEHTYHCNLDIATYVDQIKRFSRFYHYFSTVHFPFEGVNSYNRQYTSIYDEYDDIEEETWFYRYANNTSQKSIDEMIEEWIKKYWDGYKYDNDDIYDEV